MERGGVSLFRLAPGFRAPFGHLHTKQEEVYVIVSGSARVAVGDEIVALGEWDAIRIAPGVWRGMAAGPQGTEFLAFGAPNTENQDAELKQGWWPAA